MDWEALAAIPGTLSKPRKKEKRPKAPKQRKPLKKRNKKRAKAAYEVDFGPQSQACRDIGVCCCCGKAGVTEPHHLKTRKAGGDDSWAVPMFHEHHMRAHSRGAKTFWAEAGVDPIAVRDGMRAWVAAGCPLDQMPRSHR